MINDYGELVVEAARLSGATDAAQRAKLYVGMAERFLERRLKVNLPDLATYETNQLLDESPELYLHATLFQIYVGNKMNQEAEQTRGYLETLIEERERSEFSRRFTDKTVRLPSNQFA